MVVTCAVLGCLSSSRHDKNRSFFHFPKDELRCREWIRACGRPELKNKGVDTLNKSYLICDLHFHASDRLVKKLRGNAVPTVTLPDLENTYPTKSTQTENTVTTSDSTSQTDCFIIRELSSTSCATQTRLVFPANSRKRKLLQNIKNECMMKKRKNELALASAHSRNRNISPQLQKFIDVQNQLKHNSRGNRYDNDLKFFALSIYFASPRAYRIIAKTLSLPSDRTLRRININTGTKVNNSVLNCLESKIKSMKESEKYCTIGADEMSLKSNLFHQMNADKIIGFHEIDGVQTKEPATQAFVVMARGILSKWKQPLGYSFLANNINYKELNTWLDNLIANMFNIGLHIVAFVSDQGPIFLSMAKERNISIDKPYFFINEKKIFYIFDVPHLTKSVRNNLMNYDFEFNDIDGTKLLATWKPIETLYKEDNKRAYRLAPKLTESHINPNNFDKNKVKLATQVFSKTVAAAMNCCIECKQLDNISFGTVKFIELINNTFDILNSSAASDPYVYKKSFAAKPYQVETLNKFLQFLSDVIVHDKTKNIDITSTVKCFEGLKITIKSIVDLSEELRSKNFRFLFTRRLNQEPLEKFFDSVRQQSGNCRQPTPVQFSKAFKKLFMVYILKHTENAYAPTT